MCFPLYYKSYALFVCGNSHLFPSPWCTSSVPYRLSSHCLSAWFWVVMAAHLFLKQLRFIQMFPGGTFIEAISALISFFSLCFNFLSTIPILAPQWLCCGYVICSLNHYVLSLLFIAFLIFWLSIAWPWLALGKVANFLPGLLMVFVPCFLLFFLCIVDIQCYCSLRYTT